MDTKKYFDDPQTIVSSTDIKSLAKEIESSEYMRVRIEEKERFVPRIDFTTASNFAFFGSAEQYYDDAIKRIYQSYPYDGSLYERTSWHLSSSYLDNYIFENEYPRTNGYILLAVKDGAHPGTATADDNDYRSGSSAEYILFRGGPHPSSRRKGKDITDAAGTYKSGYSNIYDQSENRESNLKIDGNDGNTVEFWMKKAATPTTREVVFDTHTANAAISDVGYGRLRVELDKDAAQFNVTYMSGNFDSRAGYVTASIGQGLSFDDKWHHYAFTFKNQTSGKSVYFDGTDDYVSLNAVDFDPWNDTNIEYSVSFWFKRDSKPSAQETLIYNGLTEVLPVGTIFTLYLTTDGYLQTIIGDTDTNVASTNYCDGEWHHVVLVVYQSSGAKYKVYVDTSLAKSETSLPGSYTTPERLNFGRLANSTIYYYNGYLDEVTIWSAELSAVEVAELYNETGQYFDPTKHSKAANLVSWWDMGETTSILHPLGTNAPPPNYKLIDAVGENHGQMIGFDGGYGVVKKSKFGGHLNTKFYVDGDYNDSFKLGNPVNYVSGGMLATIGALATSLSGNGVPQLGWAPLSASLDEFRFWKTERSAQQIGRHWFTQVGGGANTDKANTHLGVYYKFNEGVLGDPALDSTILDYSGRINNGTWVGYTSGHRLVGSAIVSSSMATASYEFKDPILYKNHSDVSDYYNSSKEKGRYHDLHNNASIYHSLPAWIIDEDGENGEVLKKLTQIMASYFDTLQLQIQELPTLQNVAYPSGSYQKPHPFIRQALESKGFLTSEIFADADILAQFLDQSDKELFEEKLYNIKNQIYQNIYNSLSYVYKTKGTEKSFRNLIRCFGVDDEILKLNLYGNQVDYLIEDTFSSTTVKKNCVDFNHPDRCAASIYQFTASSNTNSVSFISGSRGVSTAPYSTGPSVFAVPFTAEAEVIFPKKRPFKEAKQHIYTELSASLFGVHTARQTNYEEVPSSEVDYNDLAWHSDDVANFQVYACRKTLQENIIYSKGYTNKDAFFLLTSSKGTQDGFDLRLTSSVFNVYDNEKWNFAVRVRPRKYPLASYVTGAFSMWPTAPLSDVENPYIIEFYGANNDLDIVSNEFLLTGTLTHEQGRAFLSSSKRVYAGAHRQNFTGSVLNKTDVKFSSLRCWLDYIDNGTIKAHARDPKNIGRSNPYKNAYLFEVLPLTGSELHSPQPYVPQMETLALNWDFTGITGSGPSNGNSYYAGDDQDASFLVADMSSGSTSITSSYGWISQVAHLQHTGKGDFFTPSNKRVISKEYIYSAKQNLPENLHSSDTINIAKTDDDVFTRQTTPTTHFFAIEKSMYQTISEEILKFFTTINAFNNLIGEPADRYRQDYKALAKLRQLFFERKTEKTGEIVNPDLEKYIDYYKWIDQSISKMIQQIVPGSARFSENIRNMVESHILERNKYWSKLPVISDKKKYSKNSLEAAAGGQGTDKTQDKPVTIIPGLDPMSPSYIVSKPDPLEQLKTSGPAQMTMRLSHEHKWEIENESKNTLAWVRTKRDELAITSGDSSLDAARKRIFDATINTRQRANRAPLKLTVHITKPIHGGVNNLTNKKMDLFRTLINKTTGSENVGLEITTTKVDENDIIKEYRDLFYQEKMKREILSTSRFNSRGDSKDTGESDYFGDSYSKWTVPFNIVSSSVTSGYVSEIVNNFSAGINFTNLHQDVYGPHYEAPMQGPFTEKWVGGWPYRHVWSQMTPVSSVHALDSDTTRVEGWRLNFKEDSDGKFVVLQSPTSASIDNPRAMIWHGPKRPVNIENIRATTGSVGDFRKPINVTNLGNYIYDYSVLQTTGRSTNNRYLVENNGIHIAQRDDQKTNSAYLPVQMVPNFTAIDRSVKGTNKFVFVNRFNAPGGPETMCESFLDVEAGEYSVYNCLTYRNWGVREKLHREFLTNHTNKGGFWSDMQHSASVYGAIQNNYLPPGSYAGAQTNISSVGYAGTTNVSGQQPMASYHNVHRNSVKRIEFKTDSKYTTVTGTVNDNWWVQHAIPRSDIQYNWIANSLINSYTGNAAYGYEKPATNTGGRYFPDASTDLTFLSVSGVNALVDFAGMNTLIYDPVSSSTNLLSALSGDYRNTSIASLSQPDDFNSLILHRQGPYGWPTWKQVRLANHPVVRQERKNNILSYMFDNTLHRFTESIATTRYKPLVHVFEEGTIVNTYGNNLANFANVEVRDELNFDLHGGDQVYDRLKSLYLRDILSLKPKLREFYYKEMLYPREINVYLSKARMRLNYDSYDPFWREARSDRTEANATNSQGQTILKQSMWALDGRTGSAAQARHRDQLVGNDGAGELQNNFTPYFGGPLDKILPSCTYARSLTSSTAPSSTGGLVYGDSIYEGGAPFYDTYGKYSHEIRKVMQAGSIVSEYRISDHMEEILDTHNGDPRADIEGFLSCPGANFADSTESGFFKTYSQTDFMKYFSVICEENKNILGAPQSKLTLTCNGVIKLLPYKGFQPAERAVQLAQDFSKSYGSTEFGSDSYSDNSKRRIALTPFFAPGLLFNSIKSGVAVDYPIYTKQPGSTTAGGTVDATVAYSVGAKGNADGGNAYRLSASFDTRLPFDALVRPQTYIGHGTSIYEAEPNPTARVSGSVESTEASRLATGSITLNQVISPKYELGMHNYLATIIDLFLKDGEVSTIVSSNNTDTYVVDRKAKGGAYKMRIYLADHQDVSTNHDRNFSMWNRQSAFGPTVHGEDSIGGYTPFTPPYYHSDAKTGYAYQEWTFTHDILHTVAARFGSFGSDTLNLDQVLANCTTSNFRSFSGSAAGGRTDSYILDSQQMSLTGAINVFKRDNRLVIQPRMEYPILNFTHSDVSKTSFDEGDTTGTGMWLQKGVYETDNSKGIFMGVLDVDGYASLADLLGLDKGLKKLGVLPDDKEKSIKEAVVAIPVIKKFNKRTKKVETKYVNVNKNTVKRAVSSVLSGTPPNNVPSSVLDMVKSMRRYVIPPQFDFLTYLKEFGSKRFRPFAMYFFEFEHEFSQEDLAKMWQNALPEIATSFKKEQVTICHTLERGQLLTLKDLKNPDLHWLVFKVKQKAKWNYFDKVYDFAGKLPSTPHAGTPRAGKQLGLQSSAKLVDSHGSANPYHTPASQAGDHGNGEADAQPTQQQKNISAQSSAQLSNQHHALSTLKPEGIRNIAEYARLESDVASGYGLDYSYNWPYDFCSLVELIKLDTEVCLKNKKQKEMSIAVSADDLATGKAEAKLKVIRPEPPPLPEGSRGRQSVGRLETFKAFRRRWENSENDE